MPDLRFIAPASRSAAQTIAVSRLLFERTQKDGIIRLAASIATGPALILGSLERAGCAVNLAQAARYSVPVVRRVTSGTAAYIGGECLWWALALPNVSALFSDAKPETLLNRNVRIWLRGLKHAHLAAHYFGREWVSLQHSPALLLGFECSKEGAVLIEALLGVDEPVALPDRLKTEGEQQLDRLRGKTCAALRGISSASGQMLFDAVLRSLAEQAGDTPQLEEEPGDAERMAVMPSPIQDAFDPIPSGCNTLINTNIPIGWLEAAGSGEAGSRMAWVGGDVMAPSWAMREVAISGEFSETIPILGATSKDILKLLFNASRQ